MRTPIKLDISAASGIVIYCLECTHWRAFRFGIDAAMDAAADHEERVHPEQKWRRDARDRHIYRRRHAV